MDKLLALSMASLWSNVHILRILANRGLVSPNELDTVYGSILENVSASDPELGALVELKLDPVFVEMKSVAEERWIGKGQTNPR